MKFGLLMKHVNGVELTPENLPPEWQVGAHEEITEAELERIMKERPEEVKLG